MNYDKQFAQARKRVFDYIDRGCRTEIQWLMDVYKQTGTIYYQSPEDIAEIDEYMEQRQGKIE